MIMLGADTDKLAINGESPLFFCCYIAMDLPDYEHKIPSYERIARRLLEVGVDPSAAPFAGDNRGLTPLHLACRMGSMGMVKLLLEYGANPHARSGPKGKRTLPEHLLPRDKVTPEFLALLQRAKATRKKAARPAQLCWCLSGEKFSDCHEEGKPVRDEAFCPCESGKRHARCCKKRQVVWYEKRDEYYEIKTAVHHNMASWMSNRKQQIREEHGREMLPTDKVFNYKDKKEFNQAMASMYNGLAEAGLIDHAFARLMGEVGFTPRYTRLLPKTEMLLRMMEWNTAADAYISSGADGRGAEELELELKIGPDHAPLRRRCNNKLACAAVEPDPAAAAAGGAAGGRFLLCARCKKVCYCSPGCQRSHWKGGHKKNCGNDEFVGLPSQYGIKIWLKAGAPQIKVARPPLKR
uniref:MYND-type domain-containing protein n=1 Tax=Heterosigma akashiwo TaxID=2829 RepID=A0A7S3Y0B2_HETAK